MLRFGNTREEVRQFFDDEPKEFFKSGTSNVPSDSFENNYVSCFYSSDMKLDALEFDFRSKLWFQGNNLFSFQQIDNLRNLFEKLDERLVDFDSGFNSLKFGISIYSPDPDEEPIEGIMVFRQGYL
jgi:hypothetical protein